MLRNTSQRPFMRAFTSLLNEVLSLNAQEFDAIGIQGGTRMILNEVLSLNAQESGGLGYGINFTLVLNEVLSLNAQE